MAVRTASRAKDLKPGEISEENVTMLQAALGKVGLATALATGDVWTSEDQSSLWSSCHPRGVLEQLEEHNATEVLPGERIVQGDIVIPDEAALAEVAYPGNVVGYWLHNRS